MMKKSDIVEKVDRSLFKGKDLFLLGRVQDFLSRNGLSYEIRGSVAESALNGNPR